MTLDRFMWTWNKGSFVSHCFDNGAVDCLAEPVAIVTEEHNPNAAQVLIMGKPCSTDFVRRFRQVFDFAEVYDDELAEAARRRFAAFRKAGFDVSLHTS